MKNYLSEIPEIEKDFIDSCWNIYANQLENFLWVEGSGRVFYATRNTSNVFGMNFDRDTKFQDLLGMDFSVFLERINESGFIILPLLHTEKQYYILTEIEILNSKEVENGKTFYFISLRSIKIENPEVKKYYCQSPEVIWAANKNKRLTYFATKKPDNSWNFKSSYKREKLSNFTLTINPVYQNIFQAAVNNCQNNLKEFSFIIEMLDENDSNKNRFVRISGRNHRDIKNDLEVIGEIFYLNEENREIWDEIQIDETVGRILIDKNGIIKFCNEKALNILGTKSLANLLGRYYQEIFIDADRDLSTGNKFLDPEKHVFRAEDESGLKLLNLVKSVKTLNQDNIAASFINALDFPQEPIYDQDKIFKIITYLNKFSLELIEGTSHKIHPLEQLLTEFEAITGYHRICVYKKKACTFGTGKYCMVANSKSYITQDFECVLCDCCNNQTIVKLERFLEENQIVFSDSLDILDEENKNRTDSVSILVPLFNLEDESDEDAINRETFWGFVSFSRSRFSIKGLSSTENEILRLVSLILSMAIKIKFIEEEKTRKYSITLNALESFRDQNSRAIKNIIKAHNELTNRMIKMDS